MNEANVSFEVPIIRIRGEILASSLPDNCFVMMTGPTTLILDADKTISGVNYYLPNDYHEEDYWIDDTFDIDRISLNGYSWSNYAMLTIEGSEALTVVGRIEIGSLNVGPDPVGTLVMKSGTLNLLHGASADIIRIEGGVVRCDESDFTLLYDPQSLEGRHIYDQRENSAIVTYSYNSDYYTNYYGLRCGNFLMSDGELKISGKRYGLCAGTMDISDGKIDIEAGEIGFSHYQTAFGNGSFFTQIARYVTGVYPILMHEIQYSLPYQIITYLSNECAIQSNPA